MLKLNAASAPKRPAVALVKAKPMFFATKAENAPVTARARLELTVSHASAMMDGAALRVPRTPTNVEAEHAPVTARARLG